MDNYNNTFFENICKKSGEKRLQIKNINWIYTIVYAFYYWNVLLLYIVEWSALLVNRENIR